MDEREIPLTGVPNVDEVLALVQSQLPDDTDDLAVADLPGISQAVTDAVAALNKLL